MRNPFRLFAAFLLLPLYLPAQTPQTTPAATPQLPVTSVPQRALPIALVNRLPACKAADLLLSTDGKDGDFNGMQHAGVLLILRNNGTAPCRLLPLAHASLLDENNKPLGPFSAAAPGAFGMHPGPVVLPIAVAVDAELTATLRWVSGPAFVDNLCLKPSTLELTLGPLTLRTPLAGQLCGERAKGVSAELSRFAPDQVLQQP